MTRPCLGINLIGPAQIAGSSVDWRLFRELTTWQGPDDCPPGDRHGDAVLVSGRVRVHFQTPPGPFFSFPPPSDASLLLPNKLPYVKLGVSDCDQQGEIVIDSDQTIVMYGPQVSVRVLAQRGEGETPDWQELPADNLQDPQQPRLTEWSANLKVRICPKPCCPDWFPLLTESHTMVPDAVLDLTIPRSARTFAISGATVPTVVQWWNGPPAVGELIATTTYATQGFEEHVPTGTHLRVLAAAAVTRPYALRWGIAP